MVLNEFVDKLKDWQASGFGEYPIFCREYEEGENGSERYFDVAMNNKDLIVKDNKLILI